jgi:tripartite-type tricarboxylate transporter receptor subunit TctC
MNLGRWAAVVGVSLWSALAGAQSWPTKPVKIVVPFTAGSATDILARTFGQKLQEYWGQPVVIENRPGAGGTIGAGVVAKSPPDGYTLLVHSAAYAYNPSIYPELPYDTVKEFVEIVPLGGQPNVLVVAPSLGIKSVADLIAQAKQKPGNSLRLRWDRQWHAHQRREIQARDEDRRRARSVQGHTGSADRHDGGPRHISSRRSPPRCRK